MGRSLVSLLGRQSRFLFASCLAIPSLLLFAKPPETQGAPPGPTAPSVPNLIPPGDYGDAPDDALAGYEVPFQDVVGQFPTRYDTTFSRYGRPGAHTVDTTKEWLGRVITREAGPKDMFDPDKVENLIDDDFDDGLVGGLCPDVVGPLANPASVALTVDVTLSPGAPAGRRYLNVLIDINHDGRWSDPPAGLREWVVRDFPVDGLVPGQTATIATNLFQVPLMLRQAWVRIALTRERVATVVPPNATGWDGSGRFLFGEVEDYLMGSFSMLTQAHSAAVAAANAQASAQAIAVAFAFANARAAAVAAACATASAQASAIAAACASAEAHASAAAFAFAQAQAAAAAGAAACAGAGAWAGAVAGACAACQCGVVCAFAGAQAGAMANACAAAVASAQAAASAAASASASASAIAAACASASAAAAAQATACAAAVAQAQAAAQAIAVALAAAQAEASAAAAAQADAFAALCDGDGIVLATASASAVTSERAAAFAAVGVLAQAQAFAEAYAAANAAASAIAVYSWSASFYAEWSAEFQFAAEFAWSAAAQAQAAAEAVAAAFANAFAGANAACVGNCVIEVCCAAAARDRVPCDLCVPGGNGNSNSPPTPEACCLGDGTCVVTTPGDCTAQGGTACGPACVEDTIVGCCLTDGGCIDVAERDCLGAGGVSNGAQNRCAAVKCVVAR